MKLFKVAKKYSPDTKVIVQAEGKTIFKGTFRELKKNKNAKHMDFSSMDIGADGVVLVLNNWPRGQYKKYIDFNKYTQDTPEVEMNEE